MRGNENERLVLFSDAVIAITITLMVLDIRLPEDKGRLSDAELWSALVALGPQYTAYILSFLVVGFFWIGHRQKFNRVIKSSGALVWLNMLFLLSISFMPFVTGLVAENGGALATMIYAGLVAWTSLVSAGMTYYAVRAGLVDSAITREQALAASWPPLSAALVFAVSIPAAAINPDFARYVWLALIPISIASTRISVNHAN